MIYKLNEAYRQRALLAVKTAQMAERLGYEVYCTEPTEEVWAVLYIELPEGQLSHHFSGTDCWMLSQFRCSHESVWDGKYNGRDEKFMVGFELTDGVK